MRSGGIRAPSWTQVGHPPYYELVVMGSEGSIVTSPGGDAVTLVAREAPDGQRVEAPALPQGRHNEAACFLSCILEGTPPAGMVGPQFCCDAQEVLEVGARAIMEQRMVPLA
jgi:predicted dehydrogenase